MNDEELSRLTIGAMLDRQTERYGDRDCIVYPDRDVRLTFKHFHDRVDLVARGLMTLGIRKAEHVAVWAPNLPEWLFLQYAIAKVGAILVPINMACRAAELEHQLRHSETTTLLFGPGSGDADCVATIHTMLPDVDEAPVGHAHFENLPRLGRLLFIGRERLAGMLRFDDLFDLGAQTQAADLVRRGSALASYDVISLNYTSGRAGSPKGALLTHRNIIVNAWHVTSRQRFTEQDRLCFAVPLYHWFGSNTASIGCVLRGACMVPIETFEPHGVLEAIATQRCTAVYGTPSIFAAVLAREDIDSYDLSCLRTGVIGAAPVLNEVTRGVAERLGAKDITVAYGLAEATAAVTQSSPDDPPERRFTSVGRALPGVQIKVVDPETGELVAPGNPGELCCRGHGVMKGYFKDPEATIAAIDSDGWFHTQDLATVDRDGFVNIVGKCSVKTGAR